MKKKTWSPDDIKVVLDAKTPTLHTPKASPDSHLTCPHCGQTGTVTSRQVKQKKGVSGGKATGAVLTGGLSMLATGLSRKEKATERTCSNCRSVWHVS